MDLDTLGCSSGPEVTMSLVVAQDAHSDLYGSLDRLTLKHQQGFRCWPRHWVSTQNLVAKGAMDIDIDPCCSRPIDSDMAMGCRSGLNVSMAPGGKQAMHISMFQTAFASSNLPLSIGHEPFCPSPVPIPHNIFAHHNGACLFSAL